MIRTKKSIWFSFVRIFFVSIFVLSIVFPFGNTALALTAQEQALQDQYDSLQKEITQWQGVLNDTKAKANSIQGDVAYLNAKIKEAQLTIQAKTIAIGQLSKQISAKNDTISQLNNKITKGQESLAQLIRQTNQLDKYSLPEVILNNKNISDFFSDLDSFSSIQRSMKEHFNEINNVKAITEKEKIDLAEKKTKEADAQHEVELKKKTITATQTEKKQLLDATQKQAKSYEAIVAEKQAKAAAIRAALFKLRDTQGVSFGDALAYANAASTKTGVRPALILAILTQESDLGKNQGSCLMTDSATGDGVGKNSGTPFEKIMKAPRDTEPFLKITARLGLDWKTQAVSCPPGYTWTANRGYGGGMGPAQFIPSTWELFKSRIGSAVGVSADQADPWNPQHAFTATALYMKDLGAGSGSFTAERNAACKYYSGSSCQPGRKPSNVFYGDQVMQTADSIQANIDFLKGV